MADTDNPFSFAISVMLFPSKTTDVSKSMRSSLILLKAVAAQDRQRIVVHLALSVLLRERQDTCVQVMLEGRALLGNQPVA